MRIPVAQFVLRMSNTRKRPKQNVDQARVSLSLLDMLLIDTNPNPMEFVLMEFVHGIWVPVYQEHV